MWRISKKCPDNICPWLWWPTKCWCFSYVWFKVKYLSLFITLLYEQITKKKLFIFFHLSGSSVFHFTSPSKSQTRWDILSLQWVVYLPWGLLPVRRAQKTTYRNLAACIRNLIPSVDSGQICLSASLSIFLSLMNKTLRYLISFARDRSSTPTWRNHVNRPQEGWVSSPVFGTPWPLPDQNQTWEGSSPGSHWWPGLIQQDWDLGIVTLGLADRSAAPWFTKCCKWLRL